MQTYTGRQFTPLAPRVEDIDIRDVAHGLAMVCRYGGHTMRYYSVAEHCYHLSFVGPRELLLHDSSEAYLGDMIRPLKYQPEMAEFRKAEHAIEACVRERFGLSTDPAVWVKVKEMDDRILVDEIQALMRDPALYLEPGGDGQSGSLAGVHPLGIRISGYEPGIAEQLFLRRFEELFPEHRRMLEG